MMRGAKTVPKILKINKIDGYKASLLFNNGESRIVDFDFFIKEVLKIEQGKRLYQVLEDETLFRQMEVVGSSIGWHALGIEFLNGDGEKTFQAYDLDPLLLYMHSELDEERAIKVGLKIRSARIAAGLTQAELAARSGTNKQYISRVENEKSDISLATLKNIVEIGLGKQFKIMID